jgi:hypothetical protein
LGGNDGYQDVFQRYGGFPDRTLVGSRIAVLPEPPGIGSEGK